MGAFQLKATVWRRAAYIFQAKHSVPLWYKPIADASDVIIDDFIMDGHETIHQESIQSSPLNITNIFKNVPNRLFNLFADYKIPITFSTSSSK